MAFVDTTPAAAPVKITESDIQKQFGKLLGTNGWNGGSVAGDATALKFIKIAYPNMLLNKNASSPLFDSKINFTFARHYLYKNGDGKYLGLAMIGKGYIRFEDIKALQAGYTTHTAFTTWLASNEDLLGQLVLDKLGDTISNTVWYYYIVEKEPDMTYATDLTLGGESFPTICSAWVQTDDDMKRFALDAEVTKTGYTATSGADKFIIREAKSDVMQSPIATSIVRTSRLEDLYSEDYEYPQQQTNWWSDSEIRVQGNVTSDSLFLMIQADNVPAWEGAVVPTIPLYFSKIDALDTGDNAYAFFTGTVAAGDVSADAVANFDMDDPSRTNFVSTILPILKTYPGKPSNGVDTVMITRSKFGARYQEYFLSWNTGPNLMPPDRSNLGKDYPRAWNNFKQEEYKFQFNPSRYSDKVHSSKIYLVHPEEGVRGSLSSTIGLSALNFNSGKLRVRREHCPTPKYDIYRYFLAEGVSPLTKRPGTAFRPIGVGIHDVASSDPA
jgi:hypothetical protein